MTTRRRLVLALAVSATTMCARAQDSPQVSLPTVTIGAFTAGTTVTAKICASISAPDTNAVIPNSVYLYRVDGAGKPVPPPVLTLSDAGVDGDDVAGDGIFCGLVSLTASGPGLLNLRVSAAFYRLLLRVLSPMATIESFPTGVPLTSQPSRLDSTGACVLSSTGGMFVADELLMFVEPGTDYGIVLQAASQVGGSVIGLQPFPRSNIWQVRLPCSSASCVESAVAALQTDPSMLRAEPNFCRRFEGVTPNDPRFKPGGGQYGPQRIEADKAWAITKGNLVTDRSSVPIIAVVDSGIDDTHPDLEGKVTHVHNYTDVAFADDCGHGTEVAGIVGAKGNNETAIAGISWHAHLLDLKTARIAMNPQTQEPDCIGTAFAESGAWRLAVDQGATVVNYSSSGPDRSKANAKAIEYANKADRLLVFAAGNQGSSVKRYPAGFGLRECFPPGSGDCYDTTSVSVGATDSQDKPWGNSNFGGWVLFYAPGVDIWTTAAGGGTVQMSGTSYAAPHVSGTASLAKAADPQRSMFSVRLRLQDDNVGKDRAGNDIHRINAFRTVFEVAAKAPQGAQVSVRGSTVTMGIANKPRDAMQGKNAHGVSVPLDAAANYDVTVVGELNSWDACNAAAGFKDCFLVALSAQPFSTIARNNGDPMLNPSLSVGFQWGGTVRGSQMVQTLNVIQGNAAMRGRGATNFLDVVLDTAAGTTADELFPSWGNLRVVDITPR